MGYALTAINIGRISALLEVYKKISPEEESEYVSFRESNPGANEWDCMEEYLKDHGYM